MNRLPEVPSIKKDREKHLFFAVFEKARPTGLEPATIGSTVRYSNQLSHGPFALTAVEVELYLSKNRLQDVLRTPATWTFGNLDPRTNVLVVTIFTVQSTAPNSLLLVASNRQGLAWRA